MLSFLISLLSYPFILNAVLASFFGSVISATAGTYITTNRFSYVAGSIAHSLLFGLGLFRFLQVRTGSSFFNPLNGAILSGIFFGIIIGFVIHSKKERVDTLLSAIWATGMSLGLLFIFLTPGYNQELMRYLFGNILLIGKAELRIIGIFDLFLVLIFLLFYNKIMAISFDSDFASIRGVNSKAFSIVFLVIIIISVILLTQLVGVVMVIALLTLPSSIALKFTTSQKKAIPLAFLICLVTSLAGLLLSYIFDLPSSAMIILILGFIYLLSGLTGILQSRAKSRKLKVRG